MSGELNELQRRMLSRQQQHYTQCAALNGITLVAAVLAVGLIFAFVWKETSPPAFRTDTEHAASYIRSDREGPPQGDTGQDTPVRPRGLAE